MNETLIRYDPETHFDFSGTGLLAHDTVLVTRAVNKALDKANSSIEPVMKMFAGRKLGYLEVNTTPVYETLKAIDRPALIAVILVAGGEGKA